MLSAVALAPATVGLLALLGRVFPDGDRAWSRLAATIGVLWAIPLPFIDGSWRSIATARPVSIVIAAGAAAAWTIVLVLPGNPAWRTTALTGVAVTGALVAASSQWSVPGVLFLGCALFACVTDMLLGQSRAAAALAAAGGVLVGTAVGVGRGSSWTFPAAVGGAPVWMCAVGVVLLFGAAHLVCSRRPSGLAPLLPLLMVGLHTLGRLLDRPYPWVAVAALAGGSALAALLATKEREALVSWTASLALASVLLVPSYTVAATAALLLALLARVAPAEDRSYGSLLRAAVPAFVPSTLGFVLIAAVTRRTFDAAVAAPDVAASAPWATAGTVVLAAFAVGLWLALRAAGAVVAAPVLGRARVLVPIAGISFLAATWPRAATGLDVSPLGAEGGVLILHVCALGVGVAAAWFVYNREDATIAVVGESVEEPAVIPASVPSESRSLLVVALMVLGLGAGAAVWLTVEGLRTGFL